MTQIGYVSVEGNTNSTVRANKDARSGIVANLQVGVGRLEETEGTNQDASDCREYKHSSKRNVQRGEVVGTSIDQERSGSTGEVSGLGKKELRGTEEAYSALGYFPLGWGRTMNPIPGG